MKRVGELVENRPVYSVPLRATVAEAVGYMAERKVGAVSVLEQERLVGIFSERDLMKRVVVAARDPRQTTPGRGHHARSTGGRCRRGAQRLPGAHAPSRHPPPSRLPGRPPARSGDDARPVAGRLATEGRRSTPDACLHLPALSRTVGSFAGRRGFPPHCILGLRQGDNQRKAPLTAGSVLSVRASFSGVRIRGTLAPEHGADLRRDGCAAHGLAVSPRPP